MQYASGIWYCFFILTHNFYFYFFCCLNFIFVFMEYNKNYVLSWDNDKFRELHWRRRINTLRNVQWAKCEVCYCLWLSRCRLLFFMRERALSLSHSFVSLCLSPAHCVSNDYTFHISLKLYKYLLFEQKCRSSVAYKEFLQNHWIKNTEQQQQQ